MEGEGGGQHGAPGAAFIPAAARRSAPAAGPGRVARPPNGHEEKEFRTTRRNIVPMAGFTASLGGEPFSRDDGKR